MNKNLLIAPFLLLPLIASCGNKSKEWKEITRAEAIAIEQQILKNAYSPKIVGGNATVKVGDRVLLSYDNIGYSENKKFCCVIGPSLDNFPPDYHVMCTNFLVIDNALWAFSAGRYEEDVTNQNRFQEIIATEGAAERLQALLIEHYYETILEFEGCVDIAESYHYLHEQDSRYDGSYSFYSYDQASIKAVVHYNKPEDVAEDYEPCSIDLEIVYENNLPVLVKNRESRKKMSSSRDFVVNFDYSKEPNVPSDANPEEWLHKSII